MADVLFVSISQAKYGIKFRVICHSATSYALKMGIYKGRENNKPEVSNLGTSVVLQLSDAYQKSGRYVTCDNFFMSLQLGIELWLNKLTFVGTIRKHRTELPAAFTATKGR